jgi:hypothetical protein
MEQMWLFNNSLIGEIPAEISNLAGLHTFHTENNDLTGAMPEAICALRDESGGKLTSLATDCKANPTPEVECLCCTCCDETCFSDNDTSGSSALDASGYDASGRYQAQAALWLDKLDSDLVQTYTQERILQKYALACIYLATNGVATTNTGTLSPVPEWDNAVGWLTEEDECKWFGIECNESGLVTKVDLPYNKMTGSMPIEIKILAPGLEHLDISGNEITNIGSDLVWIQSLTNLKHLDVHFNFFDFDGVPPYISSLTKLEFLDISYTLFYGALDGAVFAGLDALKYLEMGGNAYDSPVPTEIVSLPSLANLYIDSAHVIGDLSFIDVTTVTMFEFWMDNNPKLVGSIPASIGNLTALASLSITSCGLTGTLPSEMGDLISMQQMWFYNNTLTGSIPDEISELSSLRVLYTNGNDMSGEMPHVVCMMRDTSGGLLQELTADCSESTPVDCPCCSCCDAQCY